MNSLSIICKFLKQIKSDICLFAKSIVVPFYACVRSDNLFTTVIWFSLTIVGGLLGNIINYIQRGVLGNGNITLMQSLAIDCKSGFFYTFCLVLVTSMLGTVLIKMINSKELDFRRMKIGFMVVCIFVMLLSSVFYSITTMNKNVTENHDVIIKSQLYFCIISIVVAFYSLGISYMDDKRDNYQSVNDNLDYGSQQESNIKELIAETGEVSETSDGIKL